MRAAARRICLCCPRRFRQHRQKKEGRRMGTLKEMHNEEKGNRIVACVARLATPPSSRLHLCLPSRLFHTPNRVVSAIPPSPALASFFVSFHLVSVYLESGTLESLLHASCVVLEKAKRSRKECDERKGRENADRREREREREARGTRPIHRKECICLQNATRETAKDKKERRGGSDMMLQAGFQHSACKQLLLA
jgi:hypothetical protein